MKNILKLSVSLFFNQILAIVAGGMCIIPSRLFFGNALIGSAVFLAVTLSFFAYIEYKAAFKYGFHDSDRRNKPNSRLYLSKGLISGLISAIPLLVLVILYLISLFNGNLSLRAASTLFTGFASMYYAFPLSGIIPNHITEIFLTSLIPTLLFPWLGYIAGYKNIVIFDKICQILRIKPQE